MDDQLTVSNKKKFLIPAALFLAVFIIVTFVVIQKRNTPAQSIAQIEQTPQEPQKTDFGTSMPTDFPTDIPVEKGTKVEQSYSLNYAGQKQLTIVFLSAKTVKENYTLYADFLKEKNWNMVNNYESPKLSSLYGTKESNDINVTISENDSTLLVKSQVSISILKK